MINTIFKTVQWVKHRNEAQVTKKQENTESLSRQRVVRTFRKEPNHVVMAKACRIRAGHWLRNSVWD